MTEFAGELIGTMILIILGCGVVGGAVLNKTKSQNAGWIVITLGWGLAVAMAVYAVGGISGAHINPAVTLGLAAVGEFPWEKVPMYIGAQMIGAFIGAIVVYFHYLPHWKATEDANLKLAVFSTDPAIPNKFANLLSEIIGTFVLVLAILFIGANEFTEGLNPLIIGFLIVSIGLSLGGTTGYAINPARDLGPRIAHFLMPISGKRNSNWSYSWIPVLGPAIGGIYGALFYKAVFEQQYNILFWCCSAIIAVVAIASFLTSRKEN
ncbi:MAG: aquaporin [Flavobacteriales bacterium]|nr:MAG: aquaporin [Flavobacteriales bacterium]